MKAEDAYELAMKVTAERRAAKMRPVLDRIQKKAEAGLTETEVGGGPIVCDAEVVAELKRLGYEVMQNGGYTVASWNNPKRTERMYNR